MSRKHHRKTKDKPNRIYGLTEIIGQRGKWKGGELTQWRFERLLCYNMAKWTNNGIFSLHQTTKV